MFYHLLNTVVNFPIYTIAASLFPSKLFVYRQTRLWIFRAENNETSYASLPVKKDIRMIAWPLYVPFRYCGIIYMCAHCTCVFCYVHLCFGNSKPLQKPCVHLLLKCLIAQFKHVAIFCLPCTGGDAVIQLYDCMFIFVGPNASEA